MSNKYEELIEQPLGELAYASSARAKCWLGGSKNLKRDVTCMQPPLYKSSAWKVSSLSIVKLPRNKISMALLYYKCMIPEYLKTRVNAAVSSTGSDSTELEIPTGGQDHQLILIDQLLAPGNTQLNNADITVTINVAAEGPPAEKYDPLSICIADKPVGGTAMGVQLRDPTEYHTIGPYQGISGTSGHILSAIQEHKSTESDAARDYKHGDLQRYPQYFTIKIKPNPPNPTPQSFLPMAPWGLCSSAANGGISLSHNYPTPINPQDGLFLVLYRNKSTESYTINMLEVTIYLDA